MNDFLNQVLNYAWDNKIGIQCSDLFCPNTPCGSNPSNRMIVINTNFHDQQQLPYQAAHEVAHILNQDDGCLYMFTYSKTSMEGRANKRAIDILVPIFFEDIMPEQANVNDFLETFHIPSKMTDWATESIQNYYLNVDL